MGGCAGISGHTVQQEVYTFCQSRALGVSKCNVVLSYRPLLCALSIKASKLCDGAPFGSENKINAYEMEAVRQALLHAWLPKKKKAQQRQCRFPRESMLSRC